jgi:hypothetical protein
MENVYVVTLDVKIVDDGRLAMRLVLAQFLESRERISETLCDSNNQRFELLSEKPVDYVWFCANSFRSLLMRDSSS